MAIEIVDLPIAHGHFPVRYVNVYQAGYFFYKSHFLLPSSSQTFSSGEIPYLLSITIEVLSFQCYNSWEIPKIYYYIYIIYHDISTMIRMVETFHCHVSLQEGTWLCTAHGARWCLPFMPSSPTATAGCLSSKKGVICLDHL